MAKRHKDLPKLEPKLLLNKRDIFGRLRAVDRDHGASERIMAMEERFEMRIREHLKALPGYSVAFRKLHTNPFVIMSYAKQKKYQRPKALERDLVPAKVFSSMETSMGNMVEKVALPVYGWVPIESEMQTHESVLDGRKKATAEEDTLVCATLKSGPRTMNDDVARSIGENLVRYAGAWGLDRSMKKVDFSLGVLYGTKRESNKKDWHVLRYIDENLPAGSRVVRSHKKAWSLEYVDGPLTVTATVRNGIEWWNYLGGENAWIEVCCALIRACVRSGVDLGAPSDYEIEDLSDIVDLGFLERSYDVDVLQEDELEWLLFLARHFCDGFVVK